MIDQQLRELSCEQGEAVCLHSVAGVTISLPTSFDVPTRCHEERRLVVPII